MDLGLAGRTAIVCGASSGMGLAIAENLAAERANVAMLARRRDLLEREAERIGALAVRGDVTVPADARRLVEKTLTAFGGVDILVLNSGGPAPGPAGEITEETLEGAFELVLLSAVRLTRACLPHLKRSGRGRVIAGNLRAGDETTVSLATSYAVGPRSMGRHKAP